MECYTLALSQQYIDTGNYVVCNAANQTLAACLGTFVGATRCDRTARIGGLYRRILLPKPTVQKSPGSPHIMYQPGLPLFLRSSVMSEHAKKDLKPVLQAAYLLVH